MRKRSIWASGSLYVPSCSIGFCVAITMNGCGTSCVTPSTVTFCASMTSSSADWVFGDALERLADRARDASCQLSLAGAWVVFEQDMATDEQGGQA